MQDSNRPSAGRGGSVPNTPKGGDQGNQKTTGLTQGNAVQPGLSQLEAPIDQSAVTDSRVLFLVKRGTDYKLAQICVKGLHCREFFMQLRQEYFHLRGFFRGWLSVWRYSHCDFYRVSSLRLYRTLVLSTDSSLHPIKLSAKSSKIGNFVPSKKMTYPTTQIRIITIARSLRKMTTSHRLVKKSSEDISMHATIRNQYFIVTTSAKSWGSAHARCWILFLRRKPNLKSAATSEKNFGGSMPGRLSVSHGFCSTTSFAFCQ